LVGVLLITHGDLAQALVRSSEMIIGSNEKVAYLPLEPGIDIEAFRKDCKAMIGKLDDGDGVLILTDLFAGTPSNTALICQNGLNCECVSGVNLAMLVEALTLREDRTLQELKKAAIDEAVAAICDLKLNFEKNRGAENK